MKSQLPAERASSGITPIPGGEAGLTPASRSRLDRIANWSDLARSAGYHPAKLASLCHISPSQLRRYFFQKFGNSPRRWLKHLRLDRTAELLQTSGASLKEIAAQLGFSSESLLCHQFKTRFGCKPSDFAAHLPEETGTVGPDFRQTGVLGDAATKPGEALTRGTYSVLARVSNSSGRSSPPSDRR